MVVERRGKNEERDEDELTMTKRKEGLPHTEVDPTIRLHPQELLALIGQCTDPLNCSLSQSHFVSSSLCHLVSAFIQRRRD